MHGSRFDAWTRRRFGLAAGVTASLFGTVKLGVAEAKAEQCKDLRERCGRKRKCCKNKNLKCGKVLDRDGKRCCRPVRGKCTNDNQCCGETICEQIEGLDGSRCCRNAGAFCTSSDDCCFGAPCLDSKCAELSDLSDRTQKTNFGSVDPADMLERVRELPISTWTYASDDPGVRHIGPMAQDFAARFGVGADDRHIHPLDAQGVALAAIQGLAERLDALQTENARLAARIAEFESKT